MNPSYKKEKDNDYMILEAFGDLEGSEYQIRMLLVNDISGLLECKMRKVDGKTAFYYNITERQSMTKVFERQLMGKQDIEKLLSGLERAMDESGRYLLMMEQFVLKPDYIFRNEETGEFSFCYLPFYEGNLEEDFRELAEYILKRLDHSQEEAVLWGYDIYSRSAEDHFSIGKILESVHERTGRETAKRGKEENGEVSEPEYMDFEEGEEDQRKGEEPVQDNKSICQKEPKENIDESGQKENRKEQQNRWEEASKKKVKKKKTKQKEKLRQGINSVQTRAEIRGRSIQFFMVFLGMLGSLGIAAWAVWSQGLNFIQAGGILFLCMGLLIYFTTVFQKKPKKQKDYPNEEILQWDMFSEADDEKTVFLGGSLPEKYPVLVSMNPEKQGNVVLDKPKMTVGKQKDQADIFLDSHSVSRIHASIEMEKDGWYLRDRSSTNGTFVDGRRLKEGERWKLKDGEEICFSNLHFYYHSTTTSSG